MRFMLIVELGLPGGNLADLPSPGSQQSGEEPSWRLESYGYSAMQAGNPDQAAGMISAADALILHMPLNSIRAIRDRLYLIKPLPVFWWCSSAAAAASLAYCEEDMPVDGLLAPSMGERELHWSLHFGEKQFVEKLQWLSEKRQLEERLEERKWIDTAKGILCKLKSISEAEAYELLRKQAMNERKRIVDVAISIVKIHQLLQN